jgi:hypothetical protein
MNGAKIHLGDETEDAAPHTPWVGLLLAYAAMAPIACSAIAYLLLRGDPASLVARLAILWSGAVLCFLAGVRRGLSFRQEGGPLLTQLMSMLWIFGLGAASLLSPWAPASLALQILGYATMSVYDPIAAREHEAPRYFQRLRPVQMMIPIVSLGLILARLVT